MGVRDLQQLSRAMGREVWDMRLLGHLPRQMRKQRGTHFVNECEIAPNLRARVRVVVDRRP
jgi:hypothetical protein